MFLPLGQKYSTVDVRTITINILIQKRLQINAKNHGEIFFNFSDSSWLEKGRLRMSLVKF